MRVPFVLANWKMAMLQDQIRDYVADFTPRVIDLVDRMDIILCPPFTGIAPLRQAIGNVNIQVGAQNLHPGPQETYTGEISAPLLADAGAKWALLGHSERRRTLFETDDTVHLKVIAALENGIHPVLLIGEPIELKGGAFSFLEQKMALLLHGLTPEQAARMVLMYEPEEGIGVANTVSPQRVADSCRFMRQWITTTFGAEAGEAIRIVYGGSINPENAHFILDMQEVDGVGAGRFGRDPKSFADIARQVARARGAC